MPIKHVPRELGDMLRFFDFDFEQSHALYQTGKVYFKSPTRDSIRVMVLLGINNKSAALRLESSYQGRTDHVWLVVAVDGSLGIENSTYQMSGGMDRFVEVSYPHCSTEEEFFQQSLLFDMNGSTLDEHKKLLDLYMHYFNRSLEAYTKWKLNQESTLF